MHSLITPIKHWLVNICCCFVTWEPDRFVIRSSVRGVPYLRQRNKLGDCQLKDHLNVFENTFSWSWTWLDLNMIQCSWFTLGVQAWPAFGLMLPSFGEYEHFLFERIWNIQGIDEICMLFEGDAMDRIVSLLNSYVEALTPQWFWGKGFSEVIKVKWGHRVGFEFVGMSGLTRRGREISFLMHAPRKSHARTWWEGSGPQPKERGTHQTDPAATLISGFPDSRTVRKEH